MRAVLRSERILHPRLFRLLLNCVLPFVAEDNGLVRRDYLGVGMEMDLTEGAERIACLGVYDPLVTGFIQSICRPGDLVLDVGANAGFLAVAAALAVGPTGLVLAAEPNPVLASRLENTARVNQLRQLRVFPVAVGDCDGEASLYVSSSHPYSSLDQSYLPDYPLKGVVKVRVCSISSLLREAGVEGRSIRLAKIDAQGYEHRILHSLLDAGALADTLLVEWIADGFPEISQELRTHGYAPFLLEEPPRLIPATGSSFQGANIVWVRSTDTSGADFQARGIASQLHDC